MKRIDISIKKREKKGRIFDSIAQKPAHKTSNFVQQILIYPSQKTSFQWFIYTSKFAWNVKFKDTEFHPSAPQNTHGHRMSPLKKLEIPNHM